MIVPDSSVWIDYLNDRNTLSTARLDEAIEQQDVIVADLVALGVLRGIRLERTFNQVLERLGAFPRVTLGGFPLAVETARRYRFLRAKGVTMRKGIDCILATFCILEGHSILQKDRDFTPFVENFGLVDALASKGE